MESRILIDANYSSIFATVPKLLANSGLLVCIRMRSVLAQAMQGLESGAKPDQTTLAGVWLRET